ncbi:MAG: marine proteobacterial sortase target protein, partial [Proteobacteria bacterium]|nr:marine proteobacterial sortase target protein [Pseudomonadota bacterium]
MNTINNYYFYRAKQNMHTTALGIIHKITVVISVYLVFGLLFQHVYASVSDKRNDPYQSEHGSVWLQTNDAQNKGTYIEALQMQTDVDYKVTGAIARAKIKQQFKNTSSLWAEGIYVFPLPEKAAVDHFRMVIGDRIIEGEIKQRIIAKKIYERAKSTGKKASLIEQQRPNVFTTSLANIAPGEEISVEFEYQQVLEYKDDSYSLRFPMVVGPRYHPDKTFSQNITSHAPGETSVYTETDQSNSNKNPVRIHVLLDAGVNLYDLSSSYHRINIKQTSETRYSISTIGENISSDRDFELIWKPQLVNSPQLSAFSEEIDAEKYAMITLLPPDLSHLQQKVQARDIIFVLDISGSMSGTSIDQAKKSLITALDGLTTIDRFNIIWFNHETDRLFQGAVTATAQYKNTAKRFIENLQADGGTEMLPALKLALSDQEEFSRFRQVIFLTDGNISNETELFDVIDSRLGNNRLFTIGIGSAPNAYFMRKAANKGRGTFTYIGNINEVHNKTIALFKKLETPALINIQIDLDRNIYEVFPNIIPDLYAGETATILIKGKSLPASINVTGDYGNSEWQTSSQLTSTSRNGISVSWAREKIDSLMNLHHQSNTENERNSIEKEITDTALKHHLVSRYTSLIAVDKTPVNID